MSTKISSPFIRGSKTPLTLLHKSLREKSTQKRAISGRWGSSSMKYFLYDNSCCMDVCLGKQAGLWKFTWKGLRTNLWNFHMNPKSLNKSKTLSRDAYVWILPIESNGKKFSRTIFSISNFQKWNILTLSWATFWEMCANLSASLILTWENSFKAKK